MKEPFIISPNPKVPHHQGGGGSSMTLLSPHSAMGGQRSSTYSRHPSTSSMHMTHHSHHSHRASHATSKSCHSSVGVPHSGVTSRFRWFGWLLRGAYRYEIEDTVIIIVSPLYLYVTRSLSLLFLLIPSLNIVIPVKR